MAALFVESILLSPHQSGFTMKWAITNTGSNRLAASTW